MKVDFYLTVRILRILRISLEDEQSLFVLSIED